MRMTHRSLGLVLGIAISGVVRATETAPGLRELTDRTIRDLELQTELPQTLAPMHFSAKLPGWLAWVGIGIGLLFLLYLLKEYLPFGRARGSGEWADPAAADAARDSFLPGHLAIAEALARENKFVEAIHELLLEAVGEIRARLGARLADSLTSREILCAAPLPEPGRDALGHIIGRVEWTYFGEHPALRTDYLACREQFDCLCDALKGTPAG